MAIKVTDLVGKWLYSKDKDCLKLCDTVKPEAGLVIGVKDTRWTIEELHEQGYKWSDTPTLKYGWHSLKVKWC